jgi:putative transposase
MKKSKFTEGQIIAMIRQYEKGVKVADICREHGISQGTFYNWKGKYAGMDASQLKRLKELESEVAQYKKMPAEACLDTRVLKDVIEKKL